MNNPFTSPDLIQDHWMGRANCKGKAFELFEYQEKDSPLAAGMSFKERLAFNFANFQMAEEICIECPVFFECGRDASPEDIVWTVRQGEPPSRFDSEFEEHVNGGPVIRTGPRVCKRGHNLPNGGRCKQCKRDRMAELRGRQRGLRQKSDGVES